MMKGRKYTLYCFVHDGEWNELDGHHKFSQRMNGRKKGRTGKEKLVCAGKMRMADIQFVILLLVGAVNLLLCTRRI